MTCESCIGSGYIREFDEDEERDTWRLCADCGGHGEYETARTSKRS